MNYRRLQPSLLYKTRFWSYRITLFLFLLSILVPTSSRTAVAQSNTEAMVLEQFGLGGVSEYRLGDLDEAVPLLKQAAALKLQSRGQSSAPADIERVLAQLTTDPVARWEYAPFLLRVAFQALDTPNPTEAEEDFKEYFEVYMSYAQQMIAQKTLEEWERFVDPPLEETNTNEPTLSVLSATPSVKDFLPRPNAMKLGPNGLAAWAMLYEPMMAAASPGALNPHLSMYGQEMVNTAETLDLPVGASFGAAGLIYVSAGTMTVLPAAITSAKITANLASKMTESTVTMLSKLGGKLVAQIASSAKVFASSVLIVVPLAVAGGMKIADVAEAENFETELKKAATTRETVRVEELLSLTGRELIVQAVGPAVNARWYLVCRPGFVGDNSVCRQSCPSDFRDDGLYCAKPIISPYDRGAGYALWDYQICVNDHGRCEQWGLLYYPTCRAGFQPAGGNVCSPQPIACPPGMADIGISCRKAEYNRGEGVPAAEVGDLLTANRAKVFSFLAKMLIGDPADRGDLTLEFPQNPIVAVGTDSRLYTRLTIDSPWREVANSCCVIAAAVVPVSEPAESQSENQFTNVEVIIPGEEQSALATEVLGIGRDNQIYVRKLQNDNWTLVQNSCCVLDLAFMADGSILAVGTDGNLWTRASLDAPWNQVGNSCCVTALTVMANGTILGIGRNNMIYARGSLNDSWQLVPNSGNVIGLTVLPNGQVVGIGTDNQLYIREGLYSGWQYVPYSGSVQGISVVN